MANHKSAKTRINRKSRVRTFVKKVEAAIAASDKETAAAAFKTAESELMRSVRKGVFPMNKVARTVSRLSKKIKAL